MKTRQLLWVAAGITLFALGGLAWWAAGEPAVPGRVGPQPGSASSSGWIVTSTVFENRQQIVIADPALQSLAVYQIDGTSGQIALKSVRHVRFDLLMSEFNTEAPSPRELESLLKAQ